MIAVNTELGASLFLSSLVFFSLLLTSNQVDLSWRMPRFSLWLLQFSHSVMSDLVTPTDCNTPGFPVHHQLLELTRTHVHWVGDAIQPSHPLLSPSPPTFNLSQHQGLSQWVSSLHQVAKVLELQPQHQSFQWIFRTDLLRMDWFDLLRVFSNTTVEKHRFFGAQLSL